MIVKMLQKEKDYQMIMNSFCYTNYIDDWHFIFFRENNGVPLPKNLFFQQGELLTMGINGHSNISFLNKQQALALNAEKTSQFAFAHCIDFDTNVVSNMERLFTTKCINDDRNTYLFLRRLIKQRNRDYSCVPYGWENCTKIDDSNILKGMISSLRSFFMYMSFDTVEEFDNYFNSSTKLDNLNAINKETDDFLQLMFEMKKKIEHGEIEMVQRPIHALLLQAVIIKFSTKKGIKYKLDQLFDCFVNQMGKFMERELAICYLYLKNDKRTEKFFGKVQRNSKNILHVIEGMSWDLAHIRQLEDSMRRSIYDETSFEIHSLATYDNGLKEMLTVYPVESLSFRENYLNVAFTYEFEDFIKEVDFSNYWSKRRPEKRLLIYKKTDFTYLIKEKQRELLALIN
jgi:hypothetical protein